ncbi:hypothetical protein XENORESO_015766 [Xenotaenia resolanae]|uniref:Uncharacterized protein n=1 Tax=Xenotaenia resolanae TaxID=208358 RepID=A0ABV0X6M2_9TELE
MENSRNPVMTESIEDLPRIRKKGSTPLENVFLNFLAESGRKQTSGLGILFLLEENFSVFIQPISAQAPPTEGKQGSERLWSCSDPEPISSQVNFKGKSKLV